MIPWNLLNRTGISWALRLRSHQTATANRRSLFGTTRNFQSKPKDNQVAQKDQHRSILEEVLIKEEQKPTTFAGKTAQKAQNTFLYAIVAGSVGLLGTFAYFLFEEFFAQDSPQYIYSKALDLVRSDYRCADLFGSAIKGFGEETSRGRRRHVANHKYEKDGNERIRVKFHVKGELGEGICQVEKEKKNGEWTYRFLYVETKGHPRVTHILIDNREE